MLEFEEGNVCQTGSRRALSVGKIRQEEVKVGVPCSEEERVSAGHPF